MNMDRTTYKDKTALQTLGQFVSVKQNVDKEGSKTARKYGVTGLPTLIVVDGKGKLVSQNIGPLDGTGLSKFLKDATKKAAKGTTGKSK